MSTLGVHSEVGRLRKVMVHRPELSLQRLTPTNHDELLFDDVLWVERAQYEHDQFVAKMRERGVEVYLLQELLGEALAVSDEGRQRLIEVAVSEHTVGLSLVDEVRSVLSGFAPDKLAEHLLGGLTVAEAELDLGRLRSTSLPGAAVDDTSIFVLPPLSVYFAFRCYKKTVAEFRGFPVSACLCGLIPMAVALATVPAMSEFFDGAYRA